MQESSEVVVPHLSIESTDSLINDTITVRRMHVFGLKNKKHFGTFHLVRDWQREQ